MTKQTFKTGQTKMKVVNGKYGGWHTFQTDAEYVVKYQHNRTVLIVVSGPDKGTYVRSV